MANIHLFLERMKHLIVRRHIAFSDLSQIKGILFLEEHMELNAGYLYIGEAEQHISWLRDYTFPESVTIFLDGDTYLADPLFKRKNLNIIITETGIFPLYNRVYEIFLGMQEWSQYLVRSLCGGENPDSIIDGASKRLQGYIFLLSPGYKLMFGSKPPYFEDRFAGELQTNGYLSYDSVRQLNALFQKNSLHGDSFCSSEMETGTIYYIKHLRSGDQIIAELFFIVNNTQQYMDVFQMLDSLGNILQPLLSEDTYVSVPDSNAFDILLSDFSKGYLQSSVEIANRFQLLPHPPKKYVYCVLADCRDTDMSKEYFIDQLSSVLPESNITFQNNQLIAMFSCAEHITDTPALFDIHALNNLADILGGKIIISHATSHYEKFWTLCQLCQRMLYILNKMDIRSEYGRIYLYGDYTTYLAIDFCAQHYQTLTGHADIIYLASPAVITLMRYDRMHKTELCDVLLYYLISGCSVIKTSKMMYMHRNTVLNKLNKINQLIHMPLEDGRIQQQLLFSCQIIKYYTEVLALELNP